MANDEIKIDVVDENDTEEEIAAKEEKAEESAKTEQIEDSNNLSEKESPQKEDSDSDADDQNAKKEPPIKDKNGKTKTKFWHDPKKRLIFIISVGLFLILCFGIGLYFLFDEKPVAKNTDTSKKVEEIVKPELFESPINGVMTEKANSEKHPLAVVIENHPDARPQSGLAQADIVYEAIAEGGITRFMAIYGTLEAEKAGPVRSARTFFVDWAHGYNAYLAHVGGNMDALDKIRAEKTFDLDQFAYPASYWREYSAGLATEHTMYTNTVKLREQAAKNGYSTANNFNLWKFKDDPTTDEQKALLPESQNVNVDFSSSEYKVGFAYDKATNSYKRSLAGKSHNDKLTKAQLNPKNIIVMTVSRKPVVTRINEAGYSMTTVGTGKAQIFLDGKTITGTWKKGSTADRESFYDENGAEVIFNRGQFWICVIPPESSSSVTVS